MQLASRIQKIGTSSPKASSLRAVTNCNHVLVNAKVWIYLNHNVTTLYNIAWNVFVYVVLYNNTYWDEENKIIMCDQNVYLTAHPTWIKKHK